MSASIDEPCAGGPRRPRMTSTAIASLSVDAGGEACPCVPGGAAAGDEVLHVDAGVPGSFRASVRTVRLSAAVFDRGCESRRGARGQPEDRADRGRGVSVTLPVDRDEPQRDVAARQYGLQA